MLEKRFVAEVELLLYKEVIRTARIEKSIRPWGLTCVTGVWVPTEGSDEGSR